MFLDSAVMEAYMKRYIAELIGTFVLVFGGCGAAVLAGGKIGFGGVALAFGFSLLAMAYAIAQIVGAVIASAVLLIVVKDTAAGYDPAVGGFAANGFGEHSPGGYGVTA